MAIVVLNWNGRDLTLDCLRSLEDLDYPSWEVILVDNASCDGSAQAVRDAFPRVTVLENEANLGFSEGNNRGIAHALSRGADYVLILNNDTVLGDPGFLAVLVAYLEAHRDVAAAGPLVLYPDSGRVWSAGGRLHPVLGMCSHEGKGEPARGFASREPYRVDYVPGCCMLLSRSALAKVGMFDPDYFLYFEDLDWCFRAEERGYRCVVCPVEAVYHRKSGTSGSAGSDRLSSIQAFYYARNGILFAKKNLRGARKASFLLGQFTFKLAYSLLHLEGASALADYARGIAAGLRGRNRRGGIRP
ncbi:MAG: glycosyltransferase family 2 protein [Actinomycetota bacterium]|nr:glycosyltransferase family 2 protein [Actinomycetota bacterium]